MDIDLSIVIVSWNCRKLLQQCLVTVQAAKLECHYEIVVVDNASRDDTVAMLHADFPEIRAIANTDNLGFARANNVGFEQSSGRYILLLNPDTLIEETDSLHNLYDYLQRHPSAAAVGCQLTHQDGTHQVGDAGFRPGLGSVACHSLFLNRIFPGMFKGVFLSGQKKSDAALAVDWICAACLMLRRSVLSQVGPLREDIFMYGEDIEWGCRMHDAGLALVYLPHVRVIHIQGGAQNPGDPPSTRWIEGLARCFYERNPSTYWLGFKLLLATGFTLRAMAYLLAGICLQREEQWVRYATMRAYLKYTLGLKSKQFYVPASDSETQ